MENAHALHSLLARVRRRLRLQDVLNKAQRWLPAAAAGSLIILATGRILPIENLRVWALVPWAVWLVGIVVFALRPISWMRTARRADMALRLKERLSTSLSLSAAKGTSLYDSFSPELVAFAHADALHAARQIEPRRDFPLRANPRALQMGGVLLALALVLAFLPNPMDAVIAERRAVAEEARRQAEAIEQVQEQIASGEGLSPEEREELLRQLAELAEQLRNNPGDREQALADLSRLEEELRQRIDPRGNQRQAALEAMAAQLQALAGQENPQIGDLDAAAEALQELADQMAEMTDEQRQQMAAQLAQMAARAAQAGDSALSQSLSALSQAAQTGDPDAAQSAASDAADALAQAENDLAAQLARNRALSQLQNSRQRISGAGRQPGQMAQGDGQNQGDGQGQSQGQGQGQSQGQGQGQPGGGGGTNADQLPPGSSAGQASDPQGQGQITGSSDPQDQLYIPRAQSNTDGEDIFVPGQDTDQGETTTTERPDPLGGLNNPALIPYQEVFQQYRNAADQALEQSYIPPGMKDYVREYFSQLEP